MILILMMSIIMMMLLISKKIMLRLVWVMFVWQSFDIQTITNYMRYQLHYHLHYHHYLGDYLSHYLHSLSHISGHTGNSNVVYYNRYNNGYCYGYSLQSMPFHNNKRAYRYLGSIHNNNNNHYLNIRYNNVYNHIDLSKNINNNVIKYKYMRKLGLFSRLINSNNEDSLRDNDDHDDRFSRYKDSFEMFVRNYHRAISSRININKDNDRDSDSDDDNMNERTSTDSTPIDDVMKRNPTLQTLSTLFRRHNYHLDHDSRADGDNDDFKLGRFVFSAYQHPLRDDIVDYYSWSTELIKPLIDMQRSTIVGLEQIKFMSNMLLKGDNVVLIGNQQTLFDAQIIRIMLESMNFANIAERMVFITHPQLTRCPSTIPLLLGRKNVFVYPRNNRIGNVNDKLTSQKDAKHLAHVKETNDMGFGALDLISQAGGRLIVVYPSGTFDQPISASSSSAAAASSNSSLYQVDPFDEKILEVLDAIRQTSSQDMHFVPMSICSHRIAPVPLHLPSASDVNDNNLDVLRSWQQVNRAGVGLLFHTPLVVFKNGMLESNVFRPVYNIVSSGSTRLDSWLESQSMSS